MLPFNSLGAIDFGGELEQGLHVECLTRHNIHPQEAEVTAATCEGIVLPFTRLASGLKLCETSDVVFAAYRITL